MTEVIPSLIKFLEHYDYLIVFLGTIIAGETVILAAVFLASLKILNIYLVIFFGLLGIVISDNLWYWIGSKLKGRFNYFRKYLPLVKYQKKIDFFKRSFEHNSRKLLITSKFIYGVRIMTIIASGYQRLPYKRFFTFNFLGTLCWLTIVVLLGYVMGFSWNYLSQYNNQAKYYVLLGLLILFVLRYIFKRIINFNHHGQRP